VNVDAAVEPAWRLAARSHAVFHPHLERGPLTQPQRSAVVAGRAPVAAGREGRAVADLASLRGWAGARVSASVSVCGRMSINGRARE
jgi:hypothetical protein